MCLQTLIQKNEKSFYAFARFRIFGAQIPLVNFVVIRVNNDDVVSRFYMHVIKWMCTNFIDAHGYAYRTTT